MRYEWQDKCRTLNNIYGHFQVKRLQETARTDDIFDKRKVNLTLLPPDHLQLLRRVGSDGLLVSWAPPEDDEVTGYLVMSIMNKKFLLTFVILDLCQLRDHSESKKC